MAGKSTSRRHAVGSAAAALVLWLACATHAQALGPAALLDAVRSTRLDPDRSVSVVGVDLELGLGRMRVETGVFIPTAPIDGRTIEIVFIGKARFRIDPPDAVEAGQLELFTGRRTLDTPVEEAVLVIADPSTVDRLLDRPATQPFPTAVLERAQTIHERWLQNAERLGTGVESGMFKALVGDGAFQQYFALWCVGHDTGEFVYTYDPEDFEQLTLAAFNRIDVRGWDRHRLARHIRIQQRKGRYLGIDIDDLGAWDIWLSTPWSADVVTAPGSVGFETHHYDLDVTVRRHGLRLDGSATLQLEAKVAGRRTVALELFRDLEVTRIVDGDGNELFSFRSGPEVVVVLPRPSRIGERMSLSVSYEGRALKWVGKRTYDLESTDNWYPHCGTLDRATYDVTLRWPARYQLLSGGRRVAGGHSGKYRWERRVLDAPAIAVSFVLGKFQITQRELGGVRVTLGLSRSGGKPTAADRERTIDVINRALRFFEQVFGPYPLDELTFVVLPRSYSQSYLGFVTLTDSVLKAAELRPHSAGAWIRETTIAHELAHQWWGNLIGWWSYRDQWLSEAMANYAGFLFHARSDASGEASLADMSAGWKASLEQTVESGRTVESLGPVVLGSRLNSSEAGNGYRAIVYRKGAVVLAMLARAVGEEEFLAMLGSVVDEWMHDVVTTEDFVQALESTSGLDLGGFAAQYIYGTGVPLVYYGYEIEQDRSGAGWLLSAEAHRRIEAAWRVRVQPTAAGTWDLVRERVDNESGAPTALVVPFHVLYQPAELDTATTYDGRHNEVRQGSLMLRGAQKRFEVESESEPRKLELDPRGETLARFLSAEDNPKQYAHYHARDLIVQGHAGQAEQELLRALDAPVPESPSQLPWLRDPVAESRKEDLAIRLSLARLYLDLDRDEAAEEQLSLADELAAGTQSRYRVKRDTLQARLELRRGDYAVAYRRLKQILRLAAPPGGSRQMRDRVSRLRLKAERQALTEAYALLAVAAQETGHTDDFEWALAGARERGVDVAELERDASSHATGPPDIEARK